MTQSQANQSSRVPNYFWFQLVTAPVACTSTTDSFGNTTGTHCE